ncbi:hypothetical protein AB832_02700 [Flavobacteriaceae bacterium (ex Bugula neritina AB1)]|nr:hypothetical protein AB832_02700 [Flavobacteriaceae bacterium (ex Bugula neritina AB1)]
MCQIILRVCFLIILLVSISCKDGNKGFSENKSTKEKSKLIAVDKEGNERFRDSIKPKKVQRKIKYSFFDIETNDSQEISILWIDDKSFSFDILMDNDLCEYKDKGKAFQQKNDVYQVENHPSIRLIKFSNNKSIVQLICGYGETRDELG